MWSAHRQRTAGNMLLQTHGLNVDFLSSVRIPEGHTRSSLCQLGIGQSWSTRPTSASVNWWTASTTREMTRSSQETFMKAASCSAHPASLIRSSMVVWFVALSIGYGCTRLHTLCHLVDCHKGAGAQKRREDCTPSPSVCNQKTTYDLKGILTFLRGSL